MLIKNKPTNHYFNQKQFINEILKDKAELALAELQEMADIISKKIEKCEDELRNTLIHCGEKKAHELDPERVSIVYNYWSEMVTKKKEIFDAIRDISNHKYDGDHPVASNRCFDLLGYYVRMNHILNYTEGKKK